MNDAGDILKESCDRALSNQDLRPQYDKNGKLLTTHCNQGVRAIAQAMGCHELDDGEFTADLMLEVMRTNVSGRWIRVGGAEATIRALSGSLVVAGQTSKELGEEHGHVTVVYPVGMQASKVAGKDVPMVCNIGPGDPASPLIPIAGSSTRTRSNWICTVCWAFPVKRIGEPPYYVWSA